jgi:hypothetical protein
MDAANWSRHVIVGARVAGSATTLLLARLGYDVAVADRATFPSDTPPSGGALLLEPGTHDGTFTRTYGVKVPFMRSGDGVAVPHMPGGRLSVGVIGWRSSRRGTYGPLTWPISANHR